MASASLTIRIDESLKREASLVAEYYGFDLSSVTRAFYKQMVRERSIPLNLGSYEPNEESLEAIRETEEFLASGKQGRFSDARSLIEAALS